MTASAWYDIEEGFEYLYAEYKPAGAANWTTIATISGSSNGKPQSRAARVRQRERDLRRTVLRFHGCLSRVPRSERRVLSLRAGVGRLRPHPRSEVARITHLRRARVVMLERRGWAPMRLGDS